MEQHLLPIQSPAYILRYGGGHVDSLKKVYQKGANINELFPPKGESALHIACSRGLLETVNFLLENYADKNIQLKENGLSPLHLACMNSDKEMIRILLAAGADLTLQDKNGFSPLHLLITKDEIISRADLVLLLLEDGDCPPDLRTKDGATALHLACERSQKLVVKLLLKYGACPDAQDKDLNTPVHCLLRKGVAEIFEILKIILTKILNVNLMDKCGQSPLHIACRLGYSEIVALLLSHGANPILLDNDKLSALDVAARQNHLNCVDILRSRCVMEADHQYQEVPQNSISNNMEVRQLKHGHSSELENDKYSYQREVLQLTQELELKKRHIEWTCERLSQTEKNLHLTQEALLKSHEKTSELEKEVTNLTLKNRELNKKRDSWSNKSEAYENERRTAELSVAKLILEKANDEVELNTLQEKYQRTSELHLMCSEEATQAKYQHLELKFQLLGAKMELERQGDNYLNLQARDQIISEKDQIIQELQDRMGMLNDQLTKMEKELIIKSQNTEKLLRLQGDGLMYPHIRFIGVPIPPSEGIQLLDGIFRSSAERRDEPCRLKVEFDLKSMSKLAREIEIFEHLREYDDHHPERHEYIVNCLYASPTKTHFFTTNNLIFLDKFGEYMSGMVLRSNIRVLALELGKVNLSQFFNGRHQNHLPFIPLTQRVDILEQVVKIVQFIHKMDVIHFDLKPENFVCFLFHDRFRWKLIDFDASYIVTHNKKPIISSSDLTTVHLTEKFAAPEVLQLIHHPSSEAIAISKSMDIWSLGLVAFYILTGRTFWSEYSHTPFSSSQALRLTQEEIDAFLERYFRPKEKSLLKGCLRINPIDRKTPTQLLTNRIFSTADSTQQASSLQNSSVVLHKLTSILETEGNSLNFDGEWSGKLQEFYDALLYQIQKNNSP